MTRRVGQNVYAGEGQAPTTPPPPARPPFDPVAHLRERARSYSHDAFILHADGDKAMAVAYWTIADELTKTADQIQGGRRATRDGL